MTTLVQILQIGSGLMWLIVAAYLTPRMISAWHANADKLTMTLARNGFQGWLMFGFCVRWFIWPSAMGVMGWAELTFWAALYTMSFGMAWWFFTGARDNRGR